MLTISFLVAGRTRYPVKQEGVVLVIALIVLVAMTLAATALVRSVDTTNIIAGNLSFQQAALHSADTGIEQAINWLESANASGSLNSDDDTHGYSSAGSSDGQNPSPNETWDAYWMRALNTHRAVCVLGARGSNGMSDCDADPNTGNKVAYVIDRMCRSSGSATDSGSCTASPVSTPVSGNGEEANEVQLNAPSVVYYRITVRVAGPRNTVSYVQSMVSL